MCSISTPRDSLDGSSVAFPTNVPRRSSRSRSGRRSRSPSPLRGRVTRTPAPDLLAHSVAILASIVSEDCRFHITAPRPSRPPNALQSVVLDAAGYLLHMNRRNPRVVSQIGFALLPAFYTFRPEMNVKLLAFFDIMVMRPMLELLREAQGNALVEGGLSRNPSSPPSIDGPFSPRERRRSGRVGHPNPRRRGWRPHPGS